MLKKQYAREIELLGAKLIWANALAVRAADELAARCHPTKT